LENFELVLKDMPSTLLIGKNGTGKSTISRALAVLQSIARGTNRVGNLVQEKDFTRGRIDIPIRFEIEVLLNGKLYHYVLVLELPEGFEELRILEEQLAASGEIIYARKEGQTTLHVSSRSFEKREAQFLIDWHLVALPLIQVRSETDPVYIFKNWLKHMIILAPVPTLMNGDSTRETLEPERDASNFGEWITGLFGRYPASYALVDKYLRDVMPDLKDIQNEVRVKNYKHMRIQFEANEATLKIDFENLSDGEKCFFLCALVIAANKSYGPLFCFWDEPDNYISISEVGRFIISLRSVFGKGGQILVSSHNPEAIRGFSNENTFVLDRKNHLEPTLIRKLSELNIKGDLIHALICGDIEL